ncbi:Gcr3 protein [Candida orthopsilosis Co 90-125]|uniref:Nuclear cap-binding protein complex subunit 1 n=1 Tax=Candida orthopsilosis (strain 90-125) TaxID=1136231 RepID=H8WWP6_CANO9|nr:Gcr3 protein [Candida orthopsilosis Co 90-125]CCG21035.1 Gcr3 protein [Candida orthopsilosis Co 90-125]
MDPESNKRSRDEFEEQSGHANDGRFPPQQQNFDYDFKRQRIDPAQELINNVCKDIRRLGENSNVATQIDDVNYISNPIVAEFEKIESLRNAILSTMYALIIEQPHKINALGNLVFICNAKNFVIAKYVVEYLHTKMQLLLDSIGGEVQADTSRENAGVLNNIKSILKFFGAISPIIDDYSVVNVLKQLLQFAIDLQGGSEKRNGIAQEIYYNVLIATPYLLSNDKSEELHGYLNDIIELADKFPIIEPDSNTLIQPFDNKMENFEIPYQPKKMVSLILPALKKLQADDWQLKLFLDFEPFLEPILKTILENNAISKDIVKHKLPQLSLPSTEKMNKYKPRNEDSIDRIWQQNSRVLLQVYNQTTEFETVPVIESYIGLFFKDLSFDILTNLSFNKTEASIQLSILDLFFNRELFTPMGTSIDELIEIDTKNRTGGNNPPLSTWKIEDIAVESILTMIFQLPHTLHREIYYYTVLISCCKESPDSMAPVFGRAIRYFYNNLQTLDFELKIRFLDWMTTQISNFEFSWKWDEWVQDSQQFAKLKYHPKKNFIKNLIAKEIRLSNTKRIKESFVDVVDDRVVPFDEFYQYLDISVVPNTRDYIINYDSALYGDSEEIRTKITEIYDAKQATLAAKSNATFQDEIFYNFTNPELPLSSVASQIYEFIVSHYKSNKEMNELYNSVLEQVQQDQPQSDNMVQVDIPNPVKFVINLFFQTYAYIGSRSIYSEVSILSRDVDKLKFLSGKPIDSKKVANPDDEFEKLYLEDDDVTNRQNWIIDAIFRIWVHQPQVIFLILEYLIEFEILDPKYLIAKAFKTNLIIDNVSCIESINRILETSKAETLRELIFEIFTIVVKKLNELDLGIDDVVQIDELNEDNAPEVDKQWLFYEYLGLLKSYFRKYIKNQATESNDDDVLQNIKNVFNDLENIPARIEILGWFKELS